MACTKGTLPYMMFRTLLSLQGVSHVRWYSCSTRRIDHVGEKFQLNKLLLVLFLLYSRWCETDEGKKAIAWCPQVNRGCTVHSSWSLESICDYGNTKWGRKPDLIKHINHITAHHMKVQWLQFSETYLLVNKIVQHSPGGPSHPCSAGFQWLRGKEMERHRQLMIRRHEAASAQKGHVAKPPRSDLWAASIVQMVGSHDCSLSDGSKMTQQIHSGAWIQWEGSPSQGSPLA